MSAVVEALRAGLPVVLPTDTVYGLCADAFSEQAVRALYELKGRGKAQPTALIASGLDAVEEALPELGASEREVARALLPGPFTLVLPNPAGRFPWLAGGRPDTLGLRVPLLPAPTADAVRQLRAVAATSANLPGGPDPRRLDEVPPEILNGCGAVVDGGELPGTPSTVVDLTGLEPVVLREGAVPAEEALSRISAAAAASARD